jgi:hypothetical protein
MHTALQPVMDPELTGSRSRYGERIASSSTTFDARLQSGYAFLSPLLVEGQKTTVVIKRPILASLAAAPVTYGGIGQLVR